MDFEIIFEEALEARKKKDYETSLRLYQQILPEAEKQDKLVILNSIGLMYDELGKPKDAIKYFNDAIETYPDGTESFVPWGNKGNILLSLGKFQEARDCLIKSLEINPDCSNTKFNLEMAEYYIKNLTSDKRISDEESEYVKELVLNAAKEIELDWQDSEIEFLSPLKFREKYTSDTNKDVFEIVDGRVRLIFEFVFDKKEIYINAIDKLPTIDYLCHAIGHQVSHKKNIEDRYVNETIAFYVGSKLRKEIIDNGNLPIEDIDFLSNENIDKHETSDERHVFSLDASKIISKYYEIFEDGFEKLIKCKNRNDIEELVEILKSQDH